MYRFRRTYRKIEDLQRTIREEHQIDRAWLVSQTDKLRGSLHSVKEELKIGNDLKWKQLQLNVQVEENREIDKLISSNSEIKPSDIEKICKARREIRKYYQSFR